MQNQRLDTSSAAERPIRHDDLVRAAGGRRSTWAGPATAALLGLAVSTGAARADLTGTTMDVTITHTGQFGSTAQAVHEYGTTTTLPDPNFPTFFVEMTSPGGAAGFDNSFVLDFTEFAYGDFAGESSEILIENIAEDVDPAGLDLINEAGTSIGSITGSDGMFTATWSVDDVVNAGTGTLLLVAWDSAPAGPTIVPQQKMGAPVLGLTQDELDRFFDGQVSYNTQFLEEQGLGPVFNKESCGNCHSNPLGGPGSQSVTRFGFDDPKGGGFDPLVEFGGPLLQSQAIRPQCQEVLPPEWNVMTQRLTLGSMGYGLIEAIDDPDIVANETNPPLPGISGRARTVAPLEDPGNPRIGRFGWKADVATLLTFSADAALNEMGMTNRFLMEENDPNGIREPNLGDPDFCDTVPDPEDFPDANGRDFIDRVTDFQRFLTQPPQTPRSGMTGEALFMQVGCGACHVPGFTTRETLPLEEALRNKEIRPYSDFLLHDVGLAADFIPDAFATEREIRTPVLWGLRTRDPLWHDGRFAAGTFASRVLDAIAEHGVFGSEAIDVVAAFDALSGPERDLVVQFLDSLGRIEFDSDGDEDVELDDFLAMVDCFELPPGSFTPDDPCALFDIDQSGVVDQDDYELFLTVYTGPAEDCNSNGELDITEIINGTVLDDDGNGVPDVCEACPADFDGNGLVDFQDLLVLLANWGPCVDCPADFDGNDVVDFQDLIVLLFNWGPCL